VINLVIPDKKKAKQFCQSMLDKNIIESVNKNRTFEQKEIYRFYFDSDTVAENMLRTCWKTDAGEPLATSIALVQKIEELYCNAIVQDEEGDNVLDVDTAMKSKEYKSYIQAACELEKVSVEDLGPSQSVAFFLNVY
jgi:hypothetical protein